MSLFCEKLEILVVPVKFVDVDYFAEAVVDISEGLFVVILSSCSAYIYLNTKQSTSITISIP